MSDMIPYPSDTSRGYMDAEEGDGLVMARPERARGTVQKAMAPTLTAMGGGCGTGVVVRCDGGPDTVPRDPSEELPPLDEGDAVSMLTPGRDKRQQGPRFKADGTSFTLTAEDRHGVASMESGRLRIRYLTPRECWRLMGQPDWAYDRAVEAGTCKTQLYKQAGNSIVVDVLTAIFRGMYVEGTWDRTQTTLEGWR